MRHMNRSIPPNQQLPLNPTCRHAIAVADGVMYARLDEDERVLTPGDSVEIPPGARARVWNAGDEVATVAHRAMSPLTLAA
jgi:quercetin dioxygenase-like cupin family protein